MILCYYYIITEHIAYVQFAALLKMIFVFCVVLRIYFGLRFANGFGAVYKTQPMERVASSTNRALAYHEKLRVEI